MPTTSFFLSASSEPEETDVSVTLDDSPTGEGLTAEKMSEELDEDRQKTSLIAAIKANNGDLGSHLLAKEADPHIPSRHGAYLQHPIFIAAELERWELVKLFLSANNPIQCVPSSLGAVLWAAADSGNYDIAIALLEANANPDFTIRTLSPLHRLAQTPRQEEGAIQLIYKLIEHNAQINLTDYSGKTPPQIAEKIKNSQFNRQLKEAFRKRSDLFIILLTFESSSINLPSALWEKIWGFVGNAISYKKVHRYFSSSWVTQRAFIKIKIALQSAQIPRGAPLTQPVKKEEGEISKEASRLATLHYSYCSNYNTALVEAIHGFRREKDKESEKSGYFTVLPALGYDRKRKEKDKRTPSQISPPSPALGSLPSPVVDEKEEEKSEHSFEFPIAASFDDLTYPITLTFSDEKEARTALFNLKSAVVYCKGAQLYFTPTACQTGLFKKFLEQFDTKQAHKAASYLAQRSKNINSYYYGGFFRCFKSSVDRTTRCKAAWHILAESLPPRTENKCTLREDIRHFSQVS
ncbi:MAG: hypothetical protein K0S27_1038 [Gammaproteobacteria bacterium]|jgi:hypothetical protein|nr:hypothetical protein [Gammaproteobacteria bacterium]